MRAENWKWVEGKQTSFVFCCLVESPLYQLLEGFRNSVCVCVCERGGALGLGYTDVLFP